MPNRILKQSICSSDNIDRLTWFEEALFYRLIVNCDDYGLFDGRPSMIKNSLFPLKENLTVSTVMKAIEKLETVGLISTYYVEGRPYLSLPTWNHHQTIRAHKSKYPKPSEGIKPTSEIICKQMQADDAVIQSNPNTNPNSATQTTRVREEAFERFWVTYPKKVGKAAARKAFDKVKADIGVLISAIEVQKGSEQWQIENGRFIPNPATWLNQGRWQDELTSKTQESSFDTEDFFDKARKKAEQAMRASAN